MLNHVRSWLFVDRLSRPVVVLDRLPGLYGLKYDCVTACGLQLYLCFYKLNGSVIFSYLGLPLIETNKPKVEDFMPLVTNVNVDLSVPQLFFLKLVLWSSLT